MSSKLYVYDINVKLAVIAETEEEALGKIDQGQVSQIAMERKILSTTDIAVD
jgi:hypothetical protein